MPQVTIFVCKDDDEVRNAEGRLIKLGYMSSNIDHEAIDKVSYDGRTFNGGTGNTDLAFGGFLVIGRKN